MRLSTLAPVKTLARPRLAALLMVAAGLLAGCETAGIGTATETGKPSEPPKVEAGKPAEPPKVEPTKPEPPMTRSRAATECWMSTEKGSAGVNIDKRADTVTKCIDDKMKAAAASKT